MPFHEKGVHVSSIFWHHLTNKQANKHKICTDKFSSILWNGISKYENLNEIQRELRVVLPNIKKEI